MKNQPFVINYPIQLNDISADGKMRSWVLFNYLQDAAGRHADQLGLGLKQLRSSDLSWVLSRIRLQMDSFPEYGDTLQITTYPSGFDRLFAYRQFVLTSADGKTRYGVAGSAWLTLNPVTNRPVSPEKYLSGASQWEYELESYFQGETLGKLIAPASELTDNLEERISSAFIDYNCHLNNAFYAMFTEDWLGNKLQDLIRMDSIQINFNSAAKFADKLICSGTLAENGDFFLSGLNSSTGKNAFQASGHCTKITGELKDKFFSRA